MTTSLPVTNKLPLSDAAILATSTSQRSGYAQAIIDTKLLPRQVLYALKGINTFKGSPFVAV